MGMVPRRAHKTPERVVQNLATKERGANIAQIKKSLAPLEDWHYVGGVGQISFASGWERKRNVSRGEYWPGGGGFPAGWYGGSQRSEVEPTWPQFRKDNEGFVYLHGEARYLGDQWGPKTAMWRRPDVFTLPEGYRPEYREYLGAPGWERLLDGSTERYYWLPSTAIVETDGRVRPLLTGESGMFQSAPNPFTVIDLSGLVFRSTEIVF